MAVHIRLSRSGTKKRPYYRLMVTDHRAPNGGRFLENIGTYDPRNAGKDAAKDAEPMLNLKSDRLDYWTSKGAQMSETVERLVKNVKKAQAAVAAKAAK